MGRRGGASQHWSAGANRAAKTKAPKIKIERGTKVSAGQAKAVFGDKKRKRGDSGGGAAAAARNRGYADARMEKKRVKLEGKKQASRPYSLTGLALRAAEDGGDRMARDSGWRKERARVKMKAQAALSAVERERENLEAYMEPDAVVAHKAATRAEEKRLKEMHPIARKLEVEGNPAIGCVAGILLSARACVPPA